MNRMQAFLKSDSEPNTLESVVRRVDDVSTLPQVALKIMEAANDPNTSAADMKGVMEQDAALSTRVLRCINSSAYAMRTRITNLQQAVAYLGLKQIRNLAMTASVSDLFKRDESIECYRRLDLWRHLVSVGICSRLIAMRRRLANFEDAFLAGLLHDLGIILADQHVHEPFVRVIRALDTSITLAEVEQRHLGFDHMQLGEKLAELWGFPEPVKAAIRYHHTSVSYRGEHVQIVRCVEVANLLCTLRDITSVGKKLVRFSQPALTGLELSREDIAVLAEDLDGELALNTHLFQV